MPSRRLVVYLFGDAADESANGFRCWAVGQGSPGGLLTSWKVEVLRYLALGWDIVHIAYEMGMGHTRCGITRRTSVGSWTWGPALKQ